MNATSPVSFNFQALRPVEQSNLRWPAIGAAVSSLALAVISYFALGWVAFFTVLAAGIAFTAVVHGNASSPPPFHMQVSSNLELGRDDLNEHVPQFTNANKRRVYERLTEGRGLVEDRVILSKRVSNGDLPMRGREGTGVDFVIHPVEGAFVYPEGEDHWTANFGDRNVFFGCMGSLLAQDELQVLEFPALSHVRSMMLAEQMDEANLGAGQALLIQGAKRYGALDTQRQFPGFGTLYGNKFARAPQALIDEALEVFEEPGEKNLFVIVAPHISAAKEGEPYSYEDIEEIYRTAFTAFKEIASINQNAEIHTGNWGCGAFGNNAALMAILQIEAAYNAGLNTVHYYPMGSRADFERGIQIRDQIRAQYPNMLPRQLIRQLANRAGELGLVYGRGNGT